jgi:sec-independent protein translocase protein TatC
LSAIRPIGHEERLSLIEHLDELRTRLIWCLVTFILAFSLCYWQSDRILGWMNQPLDKAHRVDCGKKQIKDPLERSACYDRATKAYFDAAAPALDRQAALLAKVARERGVPADLRVDAAATGRSTAALAKVARAASAATPKATARQPVTLGVTEPFVTTVTVAAYAALLLALPFILFQAYAFVLPAFTREERRTALPLMMLVPVLFIAGVAFGYFLALPRAVSFLQNFNDDAFDILLQARDYYRFSVLLLAVMGLLFQIPVGVLAVTRLGVVTTDQLRRSRGYVIVGFAIVAAVVTPTPDPFTMLIAMAPLVILFELSIWLARFFEPTGPSRWSWHDDESAYEDELD